MEAQGWRELQKPCSSRCSFTCGVVESQRREGSAQKQAGVWSLHLLSSFILVSSCPPLWRRCDSLSLSPPPTPPLTLHLPTFSERLTSIFTPTPLCPKTASLQKEQRVYAGRSPPDELGSDELQSKQFYSPPQEVFLVVQRSLSFP